MRLTPQHDKRRGIGFRGSLRVTFNMGRSIFLTGATGFIGRSLLRRLDARKYDRVYCLSRGTPDARGPASSGNVCYIRASLFDSDVYADSLASSDVVIHLAATTGKARPHQYFHVNTDGTRFLIEQCRRLRVKYFLYVSSIVVKFANLSRYHYAQSKQQAEIIVRDSGLAHAILRPTIVLGKDGPIWQNLSRLAKPPVVFVFGTGTTRIQPIYIDDFVSCMVSVLDRQLFRNEIFEIGGPEIITMEEFLGEIHRVYRKRQPRVIRVPLKYLFPVLKPVEKYLYPFIPFNEGQLSPFVYDGTIEPNELFQMHRFQMKNISSMLRSLTKNE